MNRILILAVVSFLVSACAGPQVGSLQMKEDGEQFKDASGHVVRETLGEDLCPKGTFFIDPEITVNNSADTANYTGRKAYAQSFKGERKNVCLYPEQIKAIEEGRKVMPQPKIVPNIQAPAPTRQYPPSYNSAPSHPTYSPSTYDRRMNDHRYRR